jgi:hypothetical protein
MRWFWAVVFLALTASACRAQEPAGKCSPAYQNNNNIDYGPLVFRNLSGYDIDPASVRMAGGCIGLFTEEDHRLVAATTADQDGNFLFAAVVPGRYRLVVDFRGYCAANVPLRIVRWPRGGWGRKLVVHMNVGHIDTCSVGDYK